MNPYLILIIAVLLIRYLLDLITDSLNVRHLTDQLPAEFQGCYDADKYSRSQQYLRENTTFDTITDSIQTLFALIFLLAGGFNFVDHIARSLHSGPIVTGLIFIGILILAARILTLPFSIYSTFVIEEKYGFNKTTPRTFIMDIIKSLLLTALIGGIVLAAVLWFFEKTDNLAWLYCWVAITAFQVFLVFIAPYVIMPLFNKFLPLDNGELRIAIEDYARSQNFKIKGVFQMDGSKRSSKTNAFFTGFGKLRRIVLFDTLINKHTIPELVSIVGHEVGHYKKKHILWAIVRSTIQTGLTFFLLSLFIKNRQLFDAFRMDHLSIYAGLVFFGFLYTPLSMFFSVIEAIISRKQEYQADLFAVETYRNPAAMITGLKKLSVDNLSNLTPHPLKVFLQYSHPPILQRIKAIREIKTLPLAP